MNLEDIRAVFGARGRTELTCEASVYRGSGSLQSRWKVRCGGTAVAIRDHRIVPYAVCADHISPGEMVPLDRIALALGGDA